MKAYLLIILLLPFLICCQQQTSKEITLVGMLSSNDIKEVSLKSDHLNYKAPVDSSGNFVLKLTTDQSRIYQIKLEDKLKLFLIPGDSLIIKEGPEGYNLSGGQCAAIGNYYMEWEKYWDQIIDTVDVGEYYSQNPGQFAKSVHMYLDLMQLPLNKLIEKMPDIDTEFVRLEKERFKYYMYWDLLNYSMNHKHNTGKDAVLPETFNSFKEKLNLNDTSLLQLTDYKDYIVSYGYKVVFQEFLKDTTLKLDDYAVSSVILDSLPAKFSSERNRNYVLYNIFKNRIELLQVNSNNLAQFNKVCSNPDYVQKLEEKHEGLKFLLPGNPAPDFTLLDKDNKEYHLSDFKGKYLLIDVWGAYCGPCKREMPYLNKIEKEYHDKDITFVGVCFEKKRDIWLKRIEEFELEGKQFTVEGTWNSKFRKDYKVPWVPTYILIDPEGKIVHARAPKPSEGLKELLDDTLGEEA